MAAVDHVHPGQLKLFMTPGEIIGQVKSSADLYGSESMEEMWSRKEHESKFPRDPKNWRHGSGVYESVAKEGVTSHVEITPYEHRGESALHMGEGHHRVAAAAAVERDTGREQFVPVMEHMSREQYKKMYPQNLREGWT